jgi:EmrB/QacA subfamily drug resistance transporter
MERGTRMALFAMCLGVLVVANDFTALNVALPAIERDFDVDVTTVQWVINAYALVFGMLLVTAGRLADMFGRRRLFFVGITIFAAFSALGGAAPSEAWLIATRVGMGIGGGLMWPAILGMTYAALPESRASLAGALILGTAGLGNALGPLLGGVLTDELSWRWIFFLNIPIAAFAMVVTWARVHQQQRVEAQRIDYPGIGSLSAGLLLVLLAFDQATDWGWGDPRVIAMLVGAVALIGAFAAIEPRMGARALIPIDVVRNVEFRSACGVVLLLSAVYFSTILYAPQFMEKVLGYSALEAGVGMLPLLATYGVVSFGAGRLYDRLGAKLTISLGVGITIVGVFVLSLVDAGTSYAEFVPGLALAGIGIGLYAPSITTAGITGLDPSRSSLAGGLIYMCQIAGGALGLGATTAIVTLAAGGDLTSPTDLASGLDVGFLCVALAGVVGLAISILFVGGRSRPRRG